MSLAIDRTYSNRGTQWIVAILFIIYLANCATPLRLHFDSIRYFNIKDCIENGCPSDSFAHNDFLPVGYTALLLMLSKLGILKSFSIVLLNTIYLFTALYMFHKIFRSIISPLFIILLVVLNWTVIKHVTIAVSEMQFLFLSWASLFFFHMHSQKNNIWFLLLSFLFCACSIFTRTIGIALIPALLFGIFWKKDEGILAILRKNKIITAVIIALGTICLLFRKELKLNFYSNDLGTFLDDGLVNFVIRNLKGHFTELSEVFLNLSYSKVIRFISPSIAAILFISLGAFFLVILLYSVLSRKSPLPAYCKMYLIFYGIIIFSWPYYDARFWIPVLPILAVALIQFYKNGTASTKLICKIYLTGYFALGSTAIAYSTFLTFNKASFIKLQAAGAYRNEYETHFYGKPLSDTAKYIDQNVLEILKKYD